MILSANKIDKTIVSHNFTFLRATIFLMTQDQFASWLDDGVTRNMINSYERGITSPNLDLLISMDNRLDMDINVFLRKSMTMDNFKGFFNNPVKTMNYLDTLVKID